MTKHEVVEERVAELSLTRDSKWSPGPSRRKGGVSTRATTQGLAKLAYPFVNGGYLAHDTDRVHAWGR